MPVTTGGGGTAAALPNAAWPGLRSRCSDMASFGAGATTSLWPMLMSPNLRVVAVFTSGAGATTAPSKDIDRFKEDSTCGAGATTWADSAGSLKSAVGRAVADSGTVGEAGDHATTLGRGTSCLSWILGGVTTVCLELSASGGTERIGCAARTGSPLWTTAL